MNTMLITFGVFALVFLGMAIGVMLTGREIKGSCGGLNAIMGSSACDICAMKSKCKSSGKELCEEGEDCTDPQSC